MCQSGWISWVLGCVAVLCLVQTGAAQDPDHTMRQALQAEQAVQEEVHQWSQEKRALVQKILDLQTRKKWLALQNKQYTAYISQKERAIAHLQEQKQVAKSLRMELEPFLVQVVERLQAHVDQDLPFLPRERRDRLQFLRDSLQEYGLSLSERLRRVLEALAVELKYGTSVEVRDRELTLRGKPKLVQVLRIGRVDLMYVTQDGGQAGMWDTASQSWQPLSPEAASEVSKTVEIVQGKRAAELVFLPLGRPTDSKSGVSIIPNGSKGEAEP